MTISNGGPPLVDDAPNMRVVRIHINDWVASTRGMSLDEEGFFWRFTCYFYDRMGQVPDDDQIVSRALNLDIRRYRHMKALMLRLGKISLEDGRLTNARAEREINSYLTEYKRRSDAAKQRENDKRNAAATTKIGSNFASTSTRLRPDIGIEVAPMSPGLRPETDSDLFEKDSDFNRCDATSLPQGDHSSHARTRPKPKPKPIVSEESKSPHTPPMGGPSLLEQAFEDFWRAFPAGRKLAKGSARDAFRKIVTGRHRMGLRAKAEALVAAATHYAASQPDPEYVPMPSTWLNSGRWEDETTPAPGVAAPWWKDPENVSKVTDAQWRGSIAKHANGIWQTDKLGPAPGSPRCVVPKHIVDELKLTERYNQHGLSKEKH